jgi:hypothetical protein
MLEGFIGIKCPAIVESEWHQVLEGTLRQRVNKVVSIPFAQLK